MTAAGIAVLAGGFFLRALHIVWKYNVDWEPDGYQHVLLAQSLFADAPASLWYGVYVWAKPLYTFTVAIYDAVLPEGLPLVPAVQLLNTLFWFLSLLVVVRLASERCRQWATPLAVCVVGSFTYVFFRDSISANTEPMAALVFACGLWLWHRQRYNLALFLFGLLPLVRLDATLIGAVFWVAVLRDLHRTRTSKSPFWSAALATFVFVAPVALWNFAGFVHTGSAIFLLSHGYTGVGVYGSGHWFHFVVEFLKFDTVLFVFYLVGLLRIAIDRGGRDQMVVLMAVASGLHFLVLTAMWVFGLASAGLLRYFVFVYPAYLLVAAVAFDPLFASLERVSRRLVSITVALAVVVTVGQLHWLVRPPEWHHGLLTSLPENRMRFLPNNPAVRQAKAIYADRPEVLYYLHRHLRSPDLKALEQVRDPSAKGVFIFIQGWSETTAGVRLEEFQGMEQLDRFPGPRYGEIVFVFRR